MEILFENGSKITAIENAGEIIRGKVRGFIPVIQLEVGLKIECRDTIYKNILQDKYIQNNFKLKVRRLNRWWYSIYFDKKCNHDAEPLDFDGVLFCSECRGKI